MGREPRDDATIGFDFCGVARVISYREDPSFGPFAMLMAAGAVVVRITRRRSASAAALTADEQARLEALLHDGREPPP